MIQYDTVTFQIRIVHTFYSQKLLHGLEPIRFLKDRSRKGVEVSNSKPLKTPNPLINNSFWENRATYNLSCTRDWIWEHDELPSRARTSPLARLENALALHSEPFQQKKYLP